MYDQQFNDFQENNSKDDDESSIDDDNYDSEEDSENEYGIEEINQIEEESKLVQ